MNHWLGNGVYFFVNDMAAAKWWSEMYCRRHPTEKKAVLRCEVHLKEEELLDLDTEQGALKLREVYESLEREKLLYDYSAEELSYIERNSDEEKNIQRSKMIELLFELEDYKACSYSFDIKDEKYSMEYGNFTARQRQLNIKNQSIIDFDKLSMVTV